MNLNWKKVVQYGLIAGIAIWYVCLVGMVESFAPRDVIDGVLSLGMSLIVIIGLGMGYFTIRKLSPDGNIGAGIMASLLVGLSSGLITLLLIILIETTSVRNMFVAASPALVEILTFANESLSTGSLMFVAFISGVTVFGAIIYTLPNLLRRFVWAGLSAVLLIGMLEELLDVIFARSDISKSLSDVLFGQKGLSTAGVVIVFILFGGLLTLWAWQGTKVKTSVANLPPGQQKSLNWFFIALGIIFLILLPQVTGSYISQILVLVGLYTLMALGLNIEIGLAGLLDLGFVGFFAIGAYTVGVFTSPSELGLNTVMLGNDPGLSFSVFWVAIPVAVGISALAGVFLGIPVLRMRGDYLAIVTLGLAEIVRILVLSDFLRPVLGGAQGILNIPKPVIPYAAEAINVLPLQVRSFLYFFVSEVGQLKDPQHFYYLIIICCAFIAFIAYRLQHARIGRNWMALREDEDVAEAMGINLVFSKLLAFGIGAAFAGLAGAIFAAQIGSVFPTSFQLLISINVVSIVVIGGVGSIPGVILGAFVLVGLPELLREFAQFRLLIYGGLLIVMMLVKPEGLWPSEVTKREFHGHDEDLEPLPAGQTA